MEPGWDDDDLAPLRRRSPLTAVVAVLLVIALAGGAVVIAFDRTEDPDRSAPAPVADPDPPVTAGAPPTPDELDTAVAELSAFVAEARELEFKQPVEVTLLGNEAFAARIAEDAVEDIEELDETEGVLRAFGLLDDDDDLATALTSFLEAGVVGFYDPATGELVLRGAALTPYVRITLAHELTHALDDQHFELDRPLLDEADDESGLGFAAVVEGNAVRVEDEYRETLTEDERSDAAAEEARISAAFDFRGLPRVIPQLIAFPYLFGPRLVDALLDQGDEARVNEAFAKPPVTSEQVLDPESWLASDAEPVDVPPPAADGEVVDEGVLGLWGIVLVLEEELGQQDAVDAAQGWGGDWYVAWTEGAETCVRATFVMDTADELRELVAGLEDWAAGQDDAEVDRADGSVTIAACG